MVAGPEECPNPGVGIALGEPGKFEVFGCGEGLTLDVEHGGGDREKNQDRSGAEQGTGYGGA